MLRHCVKTAYHRGRSPSYLEDGTSAHNRLASAIAYLREEFPALTLRRALRSRAPWTVPVVYQKKSNNVNDLSTTHLGIHGLMSLVPLARLTVIRLDRFLTTPMATMTRWSRIKDLKEGVVQPPYYDQPVYLCRLSEMNLYPCAFNTNPITLLRKQVGRAYT